MTETAAAWAGAAQAAPAVISVSGVIRRYGRAEPVLRGIELTIRAGERVALIGPNGAGKSTLLKCLIGLLPPSEGAVEVLGERFGAQIRADQRRRLRRQTGFVFQHHGLVRRLSVLSNVVHGMLGLPGSWRGFAQGLAPRDWRARAMDALAAVALTDKAMERADALSGGQSQRVAIARALVRGPRLLIADEPAASLDPAAGHEVMAVFSDLAKAQGITLVFTSHDMTHALRYSDRVIALRAGRIAFDRPSAGIAAGELEAVFRG